MSTFGHEGYIFRITLQAHWFCYRSWHSNKSLQVLIMEKLLNKGKASGFN